MAIVPINVSTFRVDDLGDVKPSVVIGGKTEKFVPNLNLSFACESGTEKYFINLNRRSVVVADETPSVDSEDKVSLSAGNETDVWHIDDKGRLKWDVKIASHPATNVFEWDMLSSAELEFYYQPELPDSEIKKGSIRPPEVIGSYAVYCGKSGHFKDASKNTIANYATGKLAHIYRPLCRDAKGVEAWADLLIGAGKLRITIPQKYLDDAAYPVMLDPTFGYTSNGASSENSLAYHNSSKVTPAESGTISSYSAYIRFTGGDDTLYLGIYSDDGASPSHPNTRLEYGTVAVSQNAGFTWNTVTGMSYAFTGSTVYWLGRGPGNGSVSVFQEAYDSGSANESWYKNGNTLPDPFGTDATSGFQSKIYSNYATYVAAGGSAIPVFMHHYLHNMGR